MKVLLISHPGIDRTSGGAQSAINLAEALGDRGHQAAVWSPESALRTARWWNLRRTRNRAIARHVEQLSDIDVFDTPAVSAAALVRGGTRLIVRSIQPELRYLWSDVRWQLRTHPLRLAIHLPSVIGVRAAVIEGWRRAHKVLCLGTHEREWMSKRYPQWRGKLATYDCAPSANDRLALRDVRNSRSARVTKGVRFLWIGRWSPEKGIGRLVDFIRQRVVQEPDDTFTIAGCALAELPQLADLPRTRLRVVPSFARDELPAILGEHDAGLFTSSVEGWGLSVAEMLESGMPVYATEAGCVRDLQPYFPRSLRRFPPQAALKPMELEDLESNGYYRRFAWPAIAAHYEAVVAEGLPTGAFAA